MLADKTAIQSFTINTDTKHFFVPNTKYNKTATDIIFYEVLEQSNGAYSFLKLVTTKFVKADHTDMMKVRNGEVNDEFVNTTSYYLYNPTKGLNKISFKEKDILKSVDVANVDKAKIFFKQHSDEKIEEPFVIKLVQQLNTL